MIQQFAPPLPTSMIGFDRLGYFRLWVPETTGLWVCEAVMGFEVHHGVIIAAWGLTRIKVRHGVRNASWG